MEFKTIEYNTVEYIEMVEFRNDILLEPFGVPYDEEVFEQDEESTFCACYDEGELIACCVLTALDDEVVRLRQMAVIEERRKQGIGAQLISFAEGIAREYDFKEIVLHAQRTAEGFYDRCGYESYGDEFTEAGILHIMMRKKID